MTSSPYLFYDQPDANAEFLGLGKRRKACKELHPNDRQAMRNCQNEMRAKDKADKKSKRVQRRAEGKGLFNAIGGLLSRTTTDDLEKAAEDAGELMTVIKEGQLEDQTATQMASMTAIQNTSQQGKGDNTKILYLLGGGILLFVGVYVFMNKK